MQNLNDENLTPQERALEQSLSAFRPITPAIDRDALLYAAGRASAPRPTLWPWQTATALSLAATLSLLLLNLNPIRSTQTAQPPTLAHPLPIAASQSPMANYQLLLSSSAAADFPYLAARQNVLVLGLNALPTFPSTGNTSHSITANDLNAFTQ